MQQGWAGLWLNQASTTLAVTCGGSIAQQDCADKYLITALWQGEKEVLICSICQFTLCKFPCQGQVQATNLMSLSGEGGRSAPSSSTLLATSDPVAKTSTIALLHCWM